jgi:putative addiction module component (TIGR02574 family)
MAMTREQIIEEVKALDAKERHRLIQDLRHFDDFELSPEQQAELRRRLQAIDRGEIEWLDGEEVMRQLHEEFGAK